MASNFSDFDEDEAGGNRGVTNIRLEAREVHVDLLRYGREDFDRVRVGPAVATSRTAEGWCVFFFVETDCIGKVLWLGKQYIHSLILLIQFVAI